MGWSWRVVEGVAFARPGAHLTRDFDDLLAWLATRMDKTAVARLCRVSWRTVGRACERVVAAELEPDRLPVTDTDTQSETPAEVAPLTEKLNVPLRCA